MINIIVCVLEVAVIEITWILVIITFNLWYKSPLFALKHWRGYMTRAEHLDARVRVIKSACSTSKSTSTLLFLYHPHVSVCVALPLYTIFNQVKLAHYGQCFILSVSPWLSTIPLPCHTVYNSSGQHTIYCYAMPFNVARIQPSTAMPYHSTWLNLFIVKSYFTRFSWCKRAIHF